MKNLSVVTTGLLISSAALAQGDEAPDAFDRLDADDDGRISVYEAEAIPGLLEQFGRLDANGDGVLTRDEFAAFDLGR